MLLSSRHTEAARAEEGVAPLRRMDGLWSRMARAWWWSRFWACWGQVSPLQCSSQLFLLCLHKGSSGLGISAQCPALEGHSSLGHNVSSHAVGLLKASFSDKLMSQRAVKNKCLIVPVLQPARKQEFLYSTSKKHLTLCDQFLLLIITSWKTWTSAKSPRWKGARISQERLENPCISINICWSAFL